MKRRNLFKSLLALLWIPKPKAASPLLQAVPLPPAAGKIIVADDYDIIPDNECELIEDCQNQFGEMASVYRKRTQQATRHQKFMMSQTRPFIDSKRKRP